MPGPQYLRQALSGCNKWLWLYALLCLISAPFSPTPLYSLAWAFKLTLVAFLLLLCSETMHDLDDIEAFLWSSFWGMLVLAVAPFARTFAQPSTAFEGGRLNELASPTGAAAYAGTLVLLALVLHSLRKRAWLLGLAIVGATLMIMTGGKAGIAAGIASVALFYVLQRRRGAALAWLVGVFALGSVIFALTPLPTYFITYQERGHVFTLTGRTEVWKAVWLEVLEHPIVGHGYVASRLLSIEMGGRYVTELGHAHNGFLDTLYNNGLIGLTILVVIHLAIVRNLWRASKAPPNRKANLLTIGSWAMYLNLLIAGLFNSTFGGAARPPFMLLLGLVVVSEVLRRNARHPTRTAG
jgi:O-antigen ligase